MVEKKYPRYFFTGDMAANDGAAAVGQSGADAMEFEVEGDARVNSEGVDR